MKHLLLAICAYLVTLIPSQLIAMEISTTDTELYTLHITGSVIKGDHDRIVNTIKEKGHFPLSVYISSPGGDVVEAIKIGRFIRDSLLNVYAVDECNSACVLIWSGGVERDGTAAFGLHRPIYEKTYFAGLTAVEASEKYNKLDVFTRSYLSDMNIPTAVIDRMMSTKSSDVDLLTPQEFINMVGRTSPVYQEWIIAKCGELTKSEDKDYSATVKMEMVDHLSKLIGTNQEKSIYKGIIKQNKSQANYAESLSPGYRDYLKNKMKGISECTQKAQSATREKVMSSYE